MEDVFLELCLQDGDLEATKTDREEKEEKNQPIIKKKKKTSSCSDAKSNPLLSEKSTNQIKVSG